MGPGLQTCTLPYSLGKERPHSLTCLERCCMTSTEGYCTHCCLVYAISSGDGAHIRTARRCRSSVKADMHKSTIDGLVDYPAIRWMIDLDRSWTQPAFGLLFSPYKPIGRFLISPAAQISGAGSSFWESSCGMSAHVIQ